MKKVTSLLLALIAFGTASIAQPTITSLSAYSGAPGATVNITGTNFNNTPANNVVFFGATQATVTAASITSLTVTVPTGATNKSISVDNLGSNLTGYSQYPFLPTYDNTPYVEGTENFDNRINFTTGSNPHSVAIGDIDGDGKPDLVVANNGANKISVFLNTSTSGSISAGSFAAKVDFATGAAPEGVAIGDIDGDGNLDVVVANSGINTVSVLRNTSTPGSISFETKVDLSTGTTPVSVAIGDIDGNGRPEIVAANSGTNTVSVLRNTSTSGSISFAANVDFTTGTGPQSVAIGDIDGDGMPDLVVANLGPNNVSVLLNTSTSGSISASSFAARVNFAVGTAPISVAISDIDGDTKPDLITANSGTNTISLLRNTSTSGSITTGSFAAKVDIVTGTTPYSVAAGDINGDGKPDVAVTDIASNKVMVLLNTSTSGSITAGSFATEVDFTTGGSPQCVAIGDLDGDGLPDLAEVNSGPDKVSVFRNDPLQAITGVLSLCVGAMTVLSNATTGGVWTSSNTAVAAIDGTTGAMSGVGSGTAVITYAGTAGVTFPGNVVTAVVTVTGAPAVTSVSPSAGYPSSTVTITGINFNSVAANDVVRFGATQAAVTSASTTSLTVTVPTGATYMPVNVDNLECNLTGYSQYPYLPTYDNSAYVAGVLNGDVRVNFVTGTHPISVAIGDLDGDGKPDMAVANLNSATVSVFRNTSTSGSVTAGSFAAKVDFTAGFGPYSVTIGDLDGDGKPDLVIADFDANTISVLRNTATSGAITAGSFAAKVDFTTGTNPNSAAIGDLDGDGKPDLVVANYSSNTVSVYRNTSASGSITAGSFAAKVDIATEVSPNSATIRDLDGDGKPDLVVANTGANTVSVFRNIASSGSLTAGSFDAKVDFTTGNNPVGVAIGDLDGDGKPDLAVTNNGSATVSVFRNTATSGSVTAGSFAAKVDFTTGSLPYSVAMGDLNGDGKPDLGVANYASNTVSVLRNTATSGSLTTGSFAAKVDFTTELSPWGIAIGDIDGDSKPDLAVANEGTFKVSVLRNNPLRPITGTLSMCVGGTSLLSDGTTGGRWTSSNTAVATVGSTTGLVTGVSGGTAVITYAGTAGASFTGNVVTAVVSVNTIPAVGSTGGGVTICEGSNVTLNGTGATSYSWAGGVTDGVAFTSSVGINTYTVTGTTNGCSNTAITTITVNALPTVGVTGGDIAICTGSSATLSGTGATSYSWTGGITDGVAFTPAPGVNTYTVTGTTGGCSNTAVSTITVNAIPAVGYTGGGVTICYGNTTTLSGTGATSYSWTGGITDGIAFTPAVGVNTYTVTGTTAGCSNTVVATVTVNGGPAITSVSPLVGYPLSSVTITGTNFNATAANDVVWFGATQATVTAASTTSLTVTVPTGATYMPVSVNNLGCNLIGYSQYPYLPTYDNSAYVAGTENFNAKVDLASGAQVYRVAIGDIDGDGKPDLVVTNHFANTISIFRNTSTSGSLTAGSFAAKVSFATGSLPQDVEIGDVDGDGRADVVVSNASGNSVSVFRNTSTIGSITTGSLATRVNFATGVSPYSIAIGDLDGDGKPDLAVANQGSNTVSVLRNTSVSGSITTGSFAAKVDFAAASSPSSVAIGDIDGDGKPDLAVANYDLATVSVFRNTSTSGSITTGSFAAKVDFATGAAPNGVAIGDLDGDGKPDIAVANFGSATISVLRNTSSSGSIVAGSFAATVDFATAPMPEVVAIGDIDGDGRPDLAVANNGSAVVSVLRNTSSTGSITVGSFAAKVDFGVGANPAGVAVGDLDGDGKADIAVTGQATTSVSVLRNNPLQLITGTLSVCVGGTSTLSDAATGVRWTSGNTAVATVGSTTGLVTGVSSGTAVITYAGTAGVSFAGNVVTTIVTVNSTGAPAITSVSPMIGYPLSSVTITGTNFDATSTNDVVWFGATQATVTAASTASLTVTVPAGATYMPVSVDNLACNLTGYSQYPYLPTYDNSAYVAGTENFDSKLDFATGSGPGAVAIGDIDGDGKADLVVSNFSANTISIFRNTSVSGSITAGSFAAKVNFTTGSGPQDLAIGDIDGDGRPDIVVANDADNTVSVFRNISTSGSITSGSLAVRVNFATGSFPYSIAIGDLDGDGKPDLAVVNQSANTVSLLRNTSISGSITTGSFAAKVDFATGSIPNSVAIGDIDGDGKPELVVSNGFSINNSIFRNTSTAGSISASSFAAKVDFAGYSTPRRSALADIDGDGKPELIVVDQGGVFSVYRNTSTSGSISAASFAGRVNFSTGSNPTCLAIGDIDGDGKPDVAVGSSVDNIISVFRNTSTSGAITAGSFAATINFGTGAQPSGMAMGDIDGDGKPEIAVTNSASNTVSVYRNNPLQPISGTPSVCTGATTSMSDATTGGTWKSSNTAVATVGSATGLVTGVSSGTAVITYAGTAGGSFIGNIVTRIVTVNALPTVGATGGSVAICAGSNATLSGTGATSYSWTGGITDAVSFIPSLGANSYTVTGTTNGCSNTAVTAVTVNAIPTVGSTGGGVAICNGTSATLSGTGATSYSWSGGITDGVAFTPALGVNSYTVTGTTNGCSNTATTTITVNAIPTVGATGGGVAICNGTSATLSGTGATSYSWTGGITNGVAFTPALGVNSYTVTGITNGCSNTAVTTITVNAMPTVGAIGGGLAICNGSSATLSGAGATFYSWTGGITNGVAFTPALGVNTYTVTGTTGGCSNTASTTITVNAIPAVGVTGGGIAICAGATATLTGTGAASYSWTGGITNGVAFTPALGVHSYTVNGTTAGCSNTATTTITVNATSAGTITGASSVGVGANITLTDATGSGTWSASNSNATVAGGLVHGVVAGTVTISYTVTGACGTASATKVITVGTVSSTVAAITGYYFYLCVGATLPFFDATAGGTWSINAADAAIASVSGTGVVTGLSAGTARLSYTVGSSYATAIITVNPIPAAITGIGTVCQGLTTALSDITPGGVWSSGIPSTATVGSTGVVSATNTGTVPIYYTFPATGCRVTFIVTINPNPAAITGPTKVCQGASISLTDATTGGTWSGTNAYATVDGVGNVFGLAVGSVDVTYTLATGCVRVLHVPVNEVPATISGSLTVCTGSKTYLSDAVTPGVSWTSGATAFATVTASGAVTGVAAGTATITYTLPNTCSTTAVVTVNPTPTVTSILGASSVSHGGAGITLSDLTASGVWTSSNTAILTVGSATGHVTAMVSAGSANINYTVANGFGCSAVATKAISTSPAPREHGGATGTDNIDASQIVFEVKVLPNPNNGGFVISGIAGEGSDAVQLVIADMLGQKVYENQLHVTNGLLNEQVLLSNNLANGMYLLDAMYGNQHKVLRIVVEK